MSPCVTHGITGQFGQTSFVHHQGGGVTEVPFVRSLLSEEPTETNAKAGALLECQRAIRWA